MNSARRLAGRGAVWLSSPTGLVLLFLAGAAIRLVLARGDGHVFDMALFRSWAERLGDHGPSSFYPKAGEDFFVDYPPGYLYVLWGVDRVARWVGAEPIPAFLLKLPAILADLGLAFLVMRLAERLTPTTKFIRGLAVAAVVLNPSVIFVSSVWGQVEAIAALFIIGAFLLIGTGAATLKREAAGMALLAVAVGTKPQAAFVLPVVILVLVYRHSRSGVPRSIGRLALLGSAGVAAGLLLLAPFRLGPLGAVEFFANAAGTYKLTSLFAFNLWGALGSWRPDVGSDALRVFGVPAFAVGLALFSLSASLVMGRAWWALVKGVHRGRVLVFGSVALSLVGFVFMTRIHERYLFVPVVLAAALVGARPLRRAFAALSLLYLANLAYPYLHHYGSSGRPDPWWGQIAHAIYGAQSGDVRQRILSGVTAAFCLLVAWRGWHALNGVSRNHPVEDVEREHAPQVHETA